MTLSKERLESFLCPITLEVMVDPVVAADGHSYERKAISRWIRGRGRATSPVTNLPLRSRDLRPNYALKQAIHEFTAMHAAQHPRPIFRAKRRTRKRIRGKPKSETTSQITLEQMFGKFSETLFTSPPGSLPSFPNPSPVSPPFSAGLNSGTSPLASTPSARQPSNQSQFATASSTASRCEALVSGSPGPLVPPTQEPFQFSFGSSSSSFQTAYQNGDRSKSQTKSAPSLPSDQQACSFSSGLPGQMPFNAFAMPDLRAPPISSLPFDCGSLSIGQPKGGTTASFSVGSPSSSQPFSLPNGTTSSPFAPSFSGKSSADPVSTVESSSAQKIALSNASIAPGTFSTLSSAHLASVLSQPRIANGSPLFFSSPTNKASSEPAPSFAPEPFPFAPLFTIGSSSTRPKASTGSIALGHSASSPSAPSGISFDRSLTNRSTAGAAILSTTSTNCAFGSSGSNQADATPVLFGTLSSTEAQADKPPSVIDALPFQQAGFRGLFPSSSLSTSNTVPVTFGVTDSQPASGTSVSFASAQATFSFGAPLNEPALSTGHDNVLFTSGTSSARFPGHQVTGESLFTVGPALTTSSVGPSSSNDLAAPATLNGLPYAFSFGPRTSDGFEQSLGTSSSSPSTRKRPQNT